MESWVAPPLTTPHHIPLPLPLLQGAASEWAPFLATLPAATLTPILWPDEERQQLLRGSPVLQACLQGAGRTPVQCRRILQLWL